LNLEPNNLFNVFLIGYRCTGKSSVGKLLGARLDRSFSDTDSLVVSENGMSIREIVNSRGWEAFRRMEHMALQQVCTANRRVVATGGGIVLDVDNVNLMKRSGTIIWLRASPETIKSRMLQDRESETLRPALTTTDNISEIEKTMAKRAPLYRDAMDFSVDTDNVRLDSITDFIIENLKKLDPAIFC
jgi:shikimate kinase